MSSLARRTLFVCTTAFLALFASASFLTLRGAWRPCEVSYVNDSRNRFVATDWKADCVELYVLTQEKYDPSLGLALSLDLQYCRGPDRFAVAGIARETAKQWHSIRYQSEYGTHHFFTAPQWLVVAPLGAVSSICLLACRRWKRPARTAEQARAARRTRISIVLTGAAVLAFVVWILSFYAGWSLGRAGPMTVRELEGTDPDLRPLDPEVRASSQWILWEHGQLSFVITRNQYFRGEEVVFWPVHVRECSVWTASYGPERCFSPPTVSLLRRIGFCAFTVTEPGTSPASVHRVVAIPGWLLPVALGAWPILMLRRSLLLRARLRAGRCTHCGYDLRASTGRCSECGHVAALR